MQLPALCTTAAFVDKKTVINIMLAAQCSAVLGTFVIAALLTLSTTRINSQRALSEFPIIMFVVGAYAFILINLAMLFVVIPLRTFIVERFSLAKTVLIATFGGVACCFLLFLVFSHDNLGALRLWPIPQFAKFGALYGSIFGFAYYNWKRGAVNRHSVQASRTFKP